MSRTSRLLGATLGLALAGTLVVAPSQALESGYYSTTYDDVLYRHDHAAEAPNTLVASFEEWAAAGFPAPLPAPVEYVKYPWDSDVYAVHYYGPEREDWVWVYLDGQRWAKAGYPTPRAAGWRAYSTFVKVASSDEIFVGDLYSTPWHKLTPGEWRDAGSPAPEVWATTGFYRYPWSSAIGHLTDTTTGEGYRLLYPEWLGYGSPTPKTVTHVIGEVVWKKPGSATLYLDSPITGDGFRLTYEQWTALGRPAPVTR
ncbi:hypothetical protein C8046_10680 [Serinibacter arcticus]|uniref:Secreted protein n=1 Tax=Serinibacter arcticus TaxID=1655435 RepID=A0A2U1ZVS3_9MICO|nr:hypothetical protein [Serinibacter arcticus]PWD51043.1 hypothetical protein C8046_10680 [Serinibacter arcticus]